MIYLNEQPMSNKINAILFFHLHKHKEVSISQVPLAFQRSAQMEIIRVGIRMKTHLKAFYFEKNSLSFFGQTFSKLPSDSNSYELETTRWITNGGTYAKYVASVLIYKC